MEYDEFVSMFHWRGDGGADSVVELYLRRVTATLTDRSLISPPEKHDAIIAQLAALAPDAFLRVLCAPELFAALIERGAAGSAVERLLEDSLFVEAGLPDAEVSARRWSALGDAHRVAGGDRVVQLPHRLPFAVDYDSPHVDVPLKVGDYRNHSFVVSPHYRLAEAADIVEALQRALELIERCAPAAARLVSQATALVQLRRDDGNAHFFTSASCNTHIGRVVLINPHLRQHDLEALANALVHEAIHSILYMHEQEAAMLPRLDPKAPGYLVRSAWTGNQLHLHTYLHAAFVWFGLFQFWRRVSRARPNASWQAPLERARAGFLHAEVLERPAGYRAELARGLWSALERMTYEVRSAGRDHAPPPSSEAERARP